MKKIIILGNGRIPNKNSVKYLTENGYSEIYCADGGADSALKLGLLPKYIIGDLDSIKSETFDYFSDKSKIIQYKRQNDTDIEKCLKFALSENVDEAILLGATGDRLDHTFCNLGITLKYFGRMKVSILHEKTFLSVHTGKVRFKTVKGETISIYGFDKKTKITSSGLKYPLKNISLPFGISESTSNEAVGEEVKLKISGGKAFVIREFNILKKIGYFL